MKKIKNSNKNLEIKKTNDPFEVHHGDLVLHPILNKWLYVQGIGHDSKYLYVTDNLEEEVKNNSGNFSSASGDCDYSGFSRIDLSQRTSIIKQPSAPDKKDTVAINRLDNKFYQMLNGSWTQHPSIGKNACQAVSAEEYPKAKNKIHPSLQTYKGLTIFDKDKTRVHNGQNIYLKDDLTPYEVLGSDETDVFIKHNKEESDTLSNWKNIYSEDVNYIVSGQTQACCIPKSQIQFIDADRFKIGDSISIDKAITGTVIGKLIETQANGTKKSKLIVDFVKAPVLYFNKIEKIPIKDYQLSTATLEGSFNQNSFVIDANLDNVEVTKRSPKTSSKKKEKVKPPPSKEIIDSKLILIGDKITVKYHGSIISGKIAAIGTTALGRIFTIAVDEKTNIHGSFFKDLKPLLNRYNDCIDQDLKENTICFIGFRENDIVSHESINVLSGSIKDSLVGDLIISSVTKIVYKIVAKNKNLIVSIPLDNYHESFSVVQKDSRPHSVLTDDMEIDKNTDFSKVKSFITIHPDSDSFKAIVERKPVVVNSPPEIVKNTGTTLEPNGCWKRVKTSGDIIWYKDKDLKIISRLDGPAIENTNGYQAYVVDGKFHRLGGPAQIWDENNCNYFEDDKLHRLDGPACVRSNPRDNQYFIKGKCFSKEQFDQEVAKLNRAEKEELKVGDFIEIHPTFSALNLPRITQIVKIDQGRVVIKCFEDSFSGQTAKHEDGFIGCFLLSEKDRSYRKIDQQSGLFSMEKVAIPFKSGDYVETINGPGIIKDIDSSKRINRDLQIINTTITTKDAYGITRISAYNDFKDSKITPLKYPLSEAKDPLKLGSIVFDTESSSWCQVLGVENGAIYISSVEKDNQFPQSNLCDSSSFLRLSKDLISDHCSFTRIKKIKSEKDGIIYYPEFDANSKIDFNQIHQKRNGKLEPTKFKIGQVISQSIGASNFIFVVTGWTPHSESVLMERLDAQTGKIIDTPKSNFWAAFGAKSASNYSVATNYLAGSSQYQIVANSLEDYQCYCESRNHEQKTKQIDVEQQQQHRILSLFKTMISKMEENSRHLESNPEDLLEICNRENQELETIISDLEKSLESEEQGRFQFLKALTERGKTLIDDRKLQFEEQKIEPLKPIQSPTISDQATEAAYRVGAKKISAIGNTIATKVLSSVSVKPLSNISDLLKTPLGQAFSSYLAGHALSNKFPNSPKIAKLVEEIRLNGMLSAQEIAFDVGWDAVIAAVGDSSSKVRVAIDDGIKSEIEKISEDEILDEELEENQIESMSL